MSRGSWLTALVAATVLVSAKTSATPQELRGLVNAQQPVGCSDYSLLFWDFYRAELWSDAERLPGDNFGLSLTYHSAFSRNKLVESSIDEMARISGRTESGLADVRRELEQGFRDVAEGDRISAWRAAPDRLQLFLNGTQIGVLTREVDLFLGIWLGADSRNPKGREALLAGRCSG